MKKRTKIVTSVTDTATRKLGKNLAKKNLKGSEKQMATQREVKYNYPKDCTTQADRKEFRRKARQTARRMEKSINNLAKSEERGSKTSLKEATKERETFRQQTYTHQN